MSLAKKAGELTTAGRKRVSSGNFAFEKSRRYPIHDLSHARNALARASAQGTSAEQAEVKREVYSKYPALKKRKEAQEG